MTETKSSTEDKKPLNQVFQGKYMRENASFFDKLFYRYPWPLLKSSMSQEIKFEQYGDLPDRLLIKNEEKHIEGHIRHYINKDGQDRLAFVKGLVAANKFNFVKFGIVRLCLQVNELILPFVIATVLDWIQKQEPEPLEDTIRMVLFALLIPAMHMIVHTIWEYFCFQMIEVGHRAHTALKVMLFRKNFRMTAATNKDFSSGEISSIIMGESNRIWSFIWSGPDYLECPLHLISASYIVITELGWSSLIVILFTGATIAHNYWRGKTEEEINKQKSSKNQKRMLYINESFNNIKGVKLYGWENKFLNIIESTYKEELAIEDRVLLRNKLHDCLGGIIRQFMTFSVFAVYTGLGNTMTLSKMALCGIMLERIKGRIMQVPRLYEQYFSVMESMEKLWQFYCAPESQTGLVKRTKDSDDTPAPEHSVTIQGNFSWGVTPKLDKADKDKIQERLRKKDKEQKTKDMGRMRKAVFDFMEDKRAKFSIPLKERTLDEIVSLKDLDIKVKKGSFVVIIGETGSGKTSLLNALIGEMIHLPEQAISDIGDSKRGLKDGEMRYLEDALLHTDLTGKSPVTMHGTTGYCEQQAWIQNGKFRQNVIFGSDFERRRYVETILACQLEPDLAIMPAGDETEIGEKGINLSGGQKARLALARAVYKRPDVLIMDDPISALDPHVRKAIFDQVFVGLMKEKTRVLVTHAVDFVHLADHIIIMKDGKVQAQGSYPDLIFNPYMMKIQDIHTKNKNEIKEANAKAGEISDLAISKSLVMSKEGQSINEIDLGLRKKSSNISATSSEDKALVRKGQIRQTSQLFVSKSLSRQVVDEEPSLEKTPSDEDSDETLEMIELTEAEIDQKLTDFKGLNNELDANTSKIVGKLLVEEADEDVNANKETFQKMFGLIGGFRTSIFLGCIILCRKYWHIYQESNMKSFANVDPEKQADEHSNFLRQTFFVSLFAVFINNLTDFIFRDFKRKMGRDIHQSTLRKILFAPINLFFDVTPIGKILQIFTEDMNVFQGQIIEPIQHCSEMASHVIVVCSIMVAVGSWEIIVGFGILFWIMRKISQPYLHADNQLYKVGSTLWGPIHSYFHECMRGTTIIRAYGQEETILAKQHMLLDKTTIHFIAHHSCWCWFNLRMYYASKIISVLSLIVIAKQRLVTDQVTLAILFGWTIDMGWLMHFFGCLNWFMRVAVQAQRVFNLQDIPQEIAKATEETPANWPAKGELEFDNVELKYRPNTETVLNGLSFKVEPGHKVGIVGRTGAGKSTLSMALTRIVELAGGNIKIDGVDIAKIALKDLREQITMIPQEPTLFTGSLRFNLDPFEEQADDRIMDLIKKAGLEYLLEGTSKQELDDKKKKEEEDEKKKSFIAEVSGEDEEDDKKDTSAESKSDESKDKEEKDVEKEMTDAEKKEKDEEDGKGLYFKIQEEGKNLSIGERQLICIIRAILRNNKIVVLDEATANIDVVTEQSIQKLISEEFMGATVLTIAHRLNTIINSDRVLMLDKGRKLEYGSPKELMANPNSPFSKLAEDKKKKEAKGEVGE